MKISDEKLIAFMDGALDAEEMDVVSGAIADDPDLAAKLETLQAGDSALKDLFSAADEKPIRADTLALLEAASAEVEEEKPADNVVAFQPKSQKQESFSQSWVWRQQAMAASLALVFGFAGGAFVFYGGEDIEEEEEVSGFYQTASLIDTEAPLHTALETAVSATSHTIGDTEATMLTSFPVQSGSFCREYSLKSTNQLSRNIACRETAGWRVVASVAVNNPEQDQNVYITASDDAGSAIDAMIMGMMNGDVLSPDDEAKAIQTGWQK